MNELETGTHFDKFTGHFYAEFGDGFGVWEICWVYNLLMKLFPDEMNDGRFPNLDGITKMSDEQEEFLEMN